MENESLIFLVEKNSIPVQIIRSFKRKKTLTLKVSESGLCKILVPQKTTHEKISNFLHQQTDWLILKIDQIKKVKEKTHQMKFLSGENLPFLGKIYTLKIVNLPSKKKFCWLDQNELVVNSDLKMDSENSSHFTKIKLLYWYKTQAKTIINDRIQFWSLKLNLFPKKIKITNAFSRWGSCSSANHICINWRIVFSSLDSIDYILVHELSHILHKNHSRLFWQQVAFALPNFRESEKALRLQENYFMTLFR